MTANREVRILDTAEELFQAAAAEFVGQAEHAIHHSGRFTVALSGGSTPQGLYSLLASGTIPNIPWDKIYFFFGDERHVPPDHPDSNYRMAYESLLSKAPIPQENVFRVPAEDAAVIAAQAYEATLKKFFALAPGEFPRFDLILLGLGPDGHTASLFPGSTGLSEHHRLVIANWVEQFKTYRISFTYPVLNHAACDLFLVEGSEKSKVVGEILNGDRQYPANHVNPSGGRLLWLLDRAAAAELITA
jgi:6-phosphogluconolactonase